LPPPAPTSGWSLARRFGFRSLFVYLTLHLLPSLIQAVPVVSMLSDPYDDVWGAITPWVGRHVFRLSGDLSYFPTGSGDALHNYAEVLTHGFFAVVAAAIWTALDRRRDDRLPRAWLRAYARYGLGVTMLLYGFHKVFRLQFPFIQDRLIQPFGEFSPMGVLWAFMGHSAGYSFFTGAAEVLGGALLFFRRTTTLGALVLVGVLANVLALNLFYDVPVKLYSAHLLAIAVGLAALDGRRLLAVFVLNRPVPPAPENPALASRRVSLALAGVGWLLGGSTIVGQVRDSLDLRAELAKMQTESPISGLFLAESIRPAAGTPGTSSLSRKPWSKASGSGRRLGVLFADGSFLRFRAQLSEEKSTVTLTLSGTKEEVVLTYERPDAEHVVLKNEELEVRLTRADPSAFPLLQRGFHWVTEYPFNR
jgi:uncharacterized membrane protein YphA (DoxX/SURF4 family)